MSAHVRKRLNPLRPLFSIQDARRSVPGIAASSSRTAAACSSLAVMSITT
jgi:hypothetical protein